MVSNNFYFDTENWEMIQSDEHIFHFFPDGLKTQTR